MTSAVPLLCGLYISSLYNPITTSASCSKSPLSFKSDRIGLLSGLASNARDNCASAIIGTSYFKAKRFRPVDILPIFLSCLVGIYYRIALIGCNL